MKSSLSAVLTSLIISRTAQSQSLDISSSLQNILSNTHGSDLYTYPTDFTRGIIPKPIHSHNDYWRDIPFYTALSHGCISIEADVWLYNSTLYVGHETSALTSSRTFSALYVDPILDVLKRENPSSAFVFGSTKNGVFDTDSGQTLYLWVDVKTDGEKTFPYVVRALQPLRDAGCLTTWNGTMKSGAVTVIGTGNTPLNQVQGVSPRDYFFDANLALLETTQSNVTSDVSPIASTQFSRYIGQINGTEFNATQLDVLQRQIRVARKRDIGARYWDTPAWPVKTRNAVWRTLVEQGVKLLNADDLKGAAESEW